MKLFFRHLRVGRASLFLGLCVAGALAAACGGSGEASVPEGTKPVATGTSPTEPPPAPAPTGTTPPTEPPTPPNLSSTPTLRAGVGADVLAALAKGGLDPKSLPASLDDVTDRDAFQAIMESFTISLGATCEGCHVKQGSRVNYAAPSANKNVAKKMWSSFVTALKQTDGSALYCDSCHQGKMKFLDRADDEALTNWMTANFVAKLARKDSAKHSCDTCHGTPFNGDFLASWRQ